MCRDDASLNARGDDVQGDGEALYASSISQHIDDYINLSVGEFINAFYHYRDGSYFQGGPEICHYIFSLGAFDSRYQA